MLFSHKAPKLVRSSSLPYLPANHEDPQDPEVLKKVLFTKADILPGQIQMVNWAKLLPHKSFQAHYHRDMDEVFILLSGKVEAQIGTEKNIMRTGDAVLVPATNRHTMKNLLATPAEFIVFGVSRSNTGKIVLTKKP